MEKHISRWLFYGERKTPMNFTLSPRVLMDLCIHSMDLRQTQLMKYRCRSWVEAIQDLRVPQRLLRHTRSRTVCDWVWFHFELQNKKIHYFSSYSCERSKCHHYWIIIFGVVIIVIIIINIISPKRGELGLVLTISKLPCQILKHLPLPRFSSLSSSLSNVITLECPGKEKLET